VLPFANLSGDRAQEYFADGMVEEITTALSRISWLFVIARNSSFTYKGQAVDVKQVRRELGVRYVLEGSVRKSETRVRITTQLIDATNGAHLWADHFDGSPRTLSTCKIWWRSVSPGSSSQHCGPRKYGERWNGRGMIRRLTIFISARFGQSARGRSRVIWRRSIN
jgi:hypothetical protein